MYDFKFQLLQSLTVSKLQDSVEPIFFFLLLGFQHSETVFHQLVTALPDVFKQLTKSVKVQQVGIWDAFLNEWFHYRHLPDRFIFAPENGPLEAQNSGFCKNNKSAKKFQSIITACSKIIFLTSVFMITLKPLVQFNPSRSKKLVKLFCRCQFA